ncbi:MAG: Cof-type HAD-IIB family hydrolase [Patescibacteria group bacterium]|jgi:hypothetical protein
MNKRKGIRLFVVDLDETLIGLDLKISKRNTQAVRKLMRKGVNVTIASGRTFQTTLPFGKHLGVKLPLICYHGALVRTEHKVYIERMLPEQYYASLIHFARSHGVQICFYVSHHNVIYFNRPLDRFGKQYLDKIEQVREITLVDLSTYTLMRTPIKCMMIGSPERINLLYELAKKKWGRGMYITISRPTLLEFLHPAVNKGAAVEFVAKKAGIPLSQVAVIGDSYNDVPMFKVAGTSIAVRNAPRQVERHADHVVASYDHDGVAEAIEQFVI